MVTAGGAWAARPDARKMPVVDDYVPSPCVRLCTLDPRTDICLGCLRTLEEIKAWGGLDADGRRAVLSRLEERRAARRRPGT